ncbi:sigma-70 region 4 domain-containing protein [Luteimonas huabeiensis]|uniref:sigma-70 region 4 domain-containing protein n=1 Tax=Luteimonas huabeiensis TaxID=1244513 RepID=UPI0004675F11|nr:sigma-70 region 4 domain-containing protein [Luteimonas huabeiensis]
MIDAPEASPALTAFLRGVERRAALFAQLQVGDPDAGDAALTTAMVGFRDAAARTPFGEWPRRFWSLLLAAPQLREPPRAPHWRGDFAWLGEIGAGPRAALLLRLVACVSEADAAGVLGVSRATYRLALRRALPRLQDGAPDETRFRALADAAQLALRDTPPERLAELARLREAALRGRVYTPPRRAPEPAAPARPSAGATPRPRWLRPALAAVAAATLLALAATFVFPGKLGPVPDRIRLDGLPETQPAARFDEEFAIVAHPDFALLASDDAEGAARDPAFLAWLTAQLERGDVAADVARPERAEDAADTDEHALEADSEP